MLSARDILRGALTRFLPAWLAAVTFTLAVVDGQSPFTLTSTQLLLFSFCCLASLAGYTGSLVAMRRRLRSDAAVDGRKSFVAGVCSVGALIIVFALPHGLRGYATVVATYFATSAAVTLVLYAPWLRTKAGASESHREAAV